MRRVLVMASVLVRRPSRVRKSDLWCVNKKIVVGALVDVHGWLGRDSVTGLGLAHLLWS